jgi:AraC-like DNA-binding protein
MQSDGLQFHSANQRDRPLPAGRSFPDHRHSFWEIGWVIRGEALWHMRGKRSVRLRQGETIVVPPYQYHQEEAVSPVSLAWIGFKAPESPTGIPLGKLLQTGSLFGELSSTLNRLIHEDKYRPVYYEERISLVLRELLVLLRRSMQPGRTGEIQHSITALDASRAYLERNIREELTIEQVAHCHGFSISHFGVLFSSRFGETPKQYQQKCRLRAVEEMMRQGICSPKLLASSLGFSDVAYFCRWFKKWTGASPSQYGQRILARKPGPNQSSSFDHSSKRDDQAR